MNKPHSRRRFLASAIPIALAGCLVVDADENSDTPQTVADGPSADLATTGKKDQAEPINESVAATNQSGSDSLPAGIGIDRIEITRIVESNLLPQIVVDVVVSNARNLTFGTLELRIDAFYNPPDDDRTYRPPRVTERTAVGREYTEQTFEAFESGTRVFEDVVIQYDADADANDSTDPDDFDFEVVVRRAEPI